MEKLRMTSPDLSEANIAKLAELFPSVITETLDGDGNPKRTVDFDLLRQELSDHVVEGPQERYRLDWPGKRAAAFAANAPIAKTLRPMRDESVDFDTTQNIFIEGDNLDVLKLLQESYLGKVKLIYIDPPYNTGNDFVYEDDFAESAEEYLRRSGQKDDAGARLTANPESSGRFHSDWLSMMYPRLKLARNLLREDGLIAISIDDHEMAQLRVLCDRIFGSGTFLGTLTWRRRPTSDNRNYSRVSTDHEYVLLYGRTAHARVKGRGIDESKYRNPDDDPRGPWISADLTGLADAQARPNLHYTLVNPDSGAQYDPHPSRGWAKSASTMEQLVSDNRILWPAKPAGRPREKKFLYELRSRVTGLSTWVSSEEAGYNYAGTREVRELFGKKIFDFPKPLALLQFLIEQVTNGGDIVLDFFAGSGTTGHAVLEQNNLDREARRFVLVQVNEPLPATSDANETGLDSIAHVARRRLELAAQDILGRKPEEIPRALDPLDTGFRSLRVDTSNLTDVLLTADETAQVQLTSLEPSVKPGRTGEDLLFQVLLDWGLELSLPIERERMDEREVFSVDSDALIACFDHSLSRAVVRGIAERSPLRAVFRDDAFESDAERINAEQVFREVSPLTEVRTI